MANASDAAAVERVFTAEYGRAVAVLVRLCGDIDLAQDAVQDAFTAALERWPPDGVPPGAAGCQAARYRRRGPRCRRGRGGRHAHAPPAG